MDAVGIKRFFETVASDWDTMRLAYYDERVIETMADAIDIDDSQTIVDIGTGTGFIAAGLAPRAARVLALDHSPAMLDVARENLAQLGIENVELREGDLGRLPLEDDSVDAAVANMVLHHAEDPGAMLAEMARIVRPGGWVAITDEVEHPYTWMIEETPTCGSASPPTRSKASSAPRASRATAMRRWARSETCSRRLRSKSPRSASSAPGDRCRTELSACSRRCWPSSTSPASR
jgi:ArsR family transcriptional regulator